MLAKLKSVMRSRPIKILGLCLLVAIVVASALFYFKQNQTVTQSEADDTIAQVRQLQQDKKYKQAATTLQDFLDHKKMTNEVRAQLLYALGANDILTKDYKSAIDNFKQSATVKGSLSFTTAHSIADAAVLAGQKDVAIDYYQKSIDIAKSDADPYDDQSIEGYQNTIKYLQSDTQPGTKTNQIPAGINVPKEFLQ